MLCEQTHVGRVIYANKLFQDLFEVSEEMIQEGSLSMEDLLTSRGMPFYVEVSPPLYPSVSPVTRRTVLFPVDSVGANSLLFLTHSSP